MTDSDVECVHRLVELAKLVQNGLVTMGEALARARTNRKLLTVSAVPAIARAAWNEARTNRDGGCMLTGLLDEWTRTHAADDPGALYRSSDAFVRATTEILIARDDGHLYRRAHQAADRMITAARPDDLPFAHYRAGMLHLAPFALDPADQDYRFLRGHRALREHWAWPTFHLAEQVLPAPDVGLSRATYHLAAAADGFTGHNRGAVLTHLAFAEYSRGYVDDACSPDKIDQWCDAAAALMPPDGGEPLACNRLLWMYVLRRRFDRALTRTVLLPPLHTVPNGSMYTMLVGLTVVRLLGKQGEPAAARKVVDTLWPLVADDPDLDVQRIFLGSVAAHALPGDQIGCAAREQDGGSTPEQERGLSAAAVAAGRVHALVHRPGTDDPWAEGSAMRDVLAQAPQLADPIAGALAYRTWEAARLAQGRPAGQSIPLWINVVTMLIQHRFPTLAMMVLKLLENILDKAPADVFATLDLRQVLPDVLRMADTVFAWLPEACCRSTVQSLSQLLAHWATPGTHRAVQITMALMNYLKGRPLASALIEPGPTPPDAQIAHAIGMLTDLGTDIHDTPQHPAFATILAETLPTGYLHGAEREPGSTIAQQRANVRRKAQSADTFRLRAAVGAVPIRRPDLLLAMVPDDAVLLSMYVGAVGADALEGFHAVLYAGPGRLRVIGVYTPNQPVGRYIQLGGDTTDELGTDTRVISQLGSAVGRLRRLLLEDPLHRDVSRAGAGALADIAEYLTDLLLDMLGEFAASSGRTRLVFWPHESLYFLPLHLVPFQGGILADHFTVTVLPSVECLFRAGKAVPAAHPGVRAIACAAGGLSVGLPAEPSLHEQANRIAALFGTQPLIGDDATPAGALEALGTSRYLHLAAHGGQDADAPLFARVYLAGGVLHAYQILEQDLRGTELVTLSACESTLLRYDFLDNLYGLAPAFLRAGAGAVVGALWPVSPEVAETFFIKLYTYLAEDGTPVAAFRHAQNHARTRHPNYRDWGAFTYIGA